MSVKFRKQRVCPDCKMQCQLLDTFWSYGPALIAMGLEDCGLNAYEFQVSSTEYPVYEKCLCTKKGEALQAAKEAVDESFIAERYARNVGLYAFDAIHCYRNRRFLWLTSHGRYIKSKKPKELFEEISTLLKENTPLTRPLAKLPSYIIEGVRENIKWSRTCSDLREDATKSRQLAKSLLDNIEAARRVE